MNGITLDKNEFAYLLAVVNAPRVVGLDAPELFPEKASAQDKIYGQGRQKLEDDGWLKPAEDSEGEFALDALLLEMVSIVADPQFVVASLASESDDGRQMALHYLQGESIVELAAPDRDSFQIGVVADPADLHGRIAELLAIAGKNDSGKAKTVRAQLEGDQYQEILAFAKKGKADRAEAVLESTKLSKASKASLVSALGNPERGQIVVLRPTEDGIGAGRRLTVFSDNGSAWLARKLTADAGPVELSMGNVARIGALLDELTTELST